MNSTVDSPKSALMFVSRLNRLAAAAALSLLLAVGVQGRTWTSADGTKTFEGEFKSYDPATGTVGVVLPTGKAITFSQDKLSAADIAFLKENSQAAPAAEPAATPTTPATSSPAGEKITASTDKLVQKADGKPADMTKPVQVFILLGQSNMVGLGKVKGGEGSLENAVKTKGKYPYLTGEDGSWLERQDVRFVQYMQGKGRMRNEWMTVGGSDKLGPEYGIGHPLGNALDGPVMILKSCIGNRSLGWDLLPPGSEPYEFNGKTEPGYRGTPDNPKGNGEKVEGVWYAGKQYDDDVEDAKKALADLEEHYPGAKSYEVAGFFFWQGEKDCGNAAHASKYEENLVRFIKALRKDFNSPNAKFVLATLGEAVKGSAKGNGGLVMEAQLAVDGTSGKYPEFKGNVATVYSNPLSKGGSGNSHYNGNAETYMDVGEAMGMTMVELLKGK